MDNRVYAYPISMKGIDMVAQRIPVLKNKRNEHELQGEKHTVHQQQRNCLAQGIKNELIVFVRVNSLIDSWFYIINANTRFLIVTPFLFVLNSVNQLLMRHDYCKRVFSDLNRIAVLGMLESDKQFIKLFKQITKS